MIAIIDYDAGNIKSVEKALLYLGQEAAVTRDGDEILKADGVILPGVGAFGYAMEKLNACGLPEVIRKCAELGKPFLGICLGMQLLFDSSEESPGVKGLGLLEGNILRIPAGDGVKVPHIGWNDLRFSGRGRLFRGIKEGEFSGNNYVYFVHSYYLQAKEKDIVTATAEYGVTIHASVEKGNIFGCQFHPEKSSETGMRILGNFCGVCGTEGK